MTLGSISPAQADVRRFTDPRNDTTSSVDIWSVKVNNSSRHRNKIIVVVQQDSVGPGDSITIYLNTRPRDRGPEFSLSAFVASEYGMNRVETWSGDGRFVSDRCGYQLKINEGTDRSRAVIPRRCLGKPGEIRVAVKAERGFQVTSRDWAKAHRNLARLGPPLRERHDWYCKHVGAQASHLMMSTSTTAGLSAVEPTAEGPTSCALRRADVA